jgi:hypothetical protein
MASAMLVEQRLQGSIDQVEQLIHFACAAAMTPAPRSHPPSPSPLASLHSHPHPHPHSHPHPHPHPHPRPPPPPPPPSPPRPPPPPPAPNMPCLFALWQVRVALRCAACLRHADRAHLPLGRDHRQRHHQEAAAAAGNEQLIEHPLYLAAGENNTYHSKPRGGL